MGATVKRDKKENGFDFTRLIKFETEAEFEKARRDEELVTLNAWRFVSMRQPGMPSIHGPYLVKVQVNADQAAFAYVFLSKKQLNLVR